MKTFEDFQQEIIDKEGFKDLKQMIAIYGITSANAIAKAWGQYCREEGKKEGSEIVERLAKWSIKYPRNSIYSASNMEMDYELVEIEELAKSFLSGLKQTDLNKEENEKGDG